MNHPLTDEMMRKIHGNRSGYSNPFDEDDMRAAYDLGESKGRADMLKDVIEWIQEYVTPDSHYSEPDGNGDELWSYIITDSIVDDLIEAMRSQVVDLPQANSDVCGEEDIKRSWWRTLEENIELFR